MIRINLLAVERTRAKRTRTVSAVIPAAHRVTIGASIILIATVVGIGWWFWSLRTESERVDAEIVKSEAETQKLRSVLAQVQKFETRRAQLQQRVTLIEQLRKGQTGPVHVLDEVSRSLPDRLWLTSMSQRGDDYTIEGRSTSLTALSDFIANLEGTTWFKRPVEIVDSQVEPNPQAGDLVRFTVRATSAVVAPPVAPLPAGRAGAPAAH